MNPRRLLAEPRSEHPKRRRASHDHEPPANSFQVSQGLDSNRSRAAASPGPRNHQSIGGLGKGLAPPGVDGMRDPLPIDLG
jgi:hypothetical protein